MTETVALKGVDIYVPEEFTGAVYECNYADTLIFSSFDPHELFEGAVIQDDSLKPTGYFCHVGQGPYEFSRAAAFCASDGSLNLIATTSGGQSIVKITDIKTPISWTYSPLDSIVQGLYFTSRNIVSDENYNILLAAAPLNSPKNIFAVINTNSKDFVPLDYWPDDGFDGNDFIKHRIYSDNSRLYSNSNGKYVFSTAINRNVFIFTIEKEHVNIERILYNNPFEYNPTADGLNFRGKPSAESLRLCADSSYIYILLTDSNRDGHKSNSFEDSRFGNIVEVYDWDGNLKKKYVLDTYCTGIYTYNDSSNLLLSSFDGNNNLKFIRYPID
ncbi:MAG: hypothetical protein HFJ94_04145 [Muribaculaceae bacterium]|jgi:hypothetical protein|nr:hypothetical protein [Muribaculaceae bacterium]